MVRGLLWDRGPVSPELASPALANVLSSARAIARAPGLSALIVGEPGAPARAIAELIHSATPSPPRGSPWVEVQCAGIPEAIVEAELFEGSTPAARALKPAVERARGGTLFLDSIPHLGQSAQARLLALLLHKSREQDRERLVRVVASSYENLRSVARDRRLRGDLIQALSTVTIAIPPLRVRIADIEALATAFASGEAEDLRRQFQGFSQEARAKLVAHPYRENEAELRRVIKRAFVLSPEAIITASAVVFDTAMPDASDAFVEEVASADLDRKRPPPTLADVEAAYVVWMLKHTKLNRTAAARLLGISYPTIMKKIRDHHIVLASIAEGLGIKLK